MLEYEYHFEAKVQIIDFGRLQYTVVYLPKKITKRLPLDENPRLRIEGAVNGVRINSAITPTANKKHYLLLSKKLLKSCGLSVGERANVRFDIADQDAVDVPNELRHALQANDVAADVWERITPGKKRGLAYRVSSAKRASTRELRVEEVIAILIEME